MNFDSGSNFSKDPFVKKIVKGIVFVFILNYLILNAIPHMENGQVELYSVLLLIPNGIFACAATSEMALRIQKGNINFKKDNHSARFFFIVHAILSTSTSFLLNWAAGCNSDSCDIREGANYLLTLLFAYAMTLIVPFFVVYFLVNVVLKFLNKK